MNAVSSNASAKCRARRGRRQRMASIGIVVASVLWHSSVLRANPADGELPTGWSRIDGQATEPEISGS